jgi:hypothetical protein
MSHTVVLSDAEARKMLSILSMATIEYADLIKTLCEQTGLPMPESTREWLEERNSWR